MRLGLESRCHCTWRVSPVGTRKYGWSEVVEAHALCHKLGVKKVAYGAQLAMIGAFRMSCSHYLF